MWVVPDTCVDSARNICDSTRNIGLTVVLGSIQTLTEVGTRNISWGLRRPVPRADNIKHLHVPIV
jgi:hypothetical protein